MKDWACREYGIDPDTVVRPFWPGGDYQAFDYPDGCTVIDNPPFSIIKQIKSWYLESGTDFFLFAPTLTLLSGADLTCKLTHIAANANITYANGARVNTSFVTNMGGDVVLMSCPSLTKAVNDANEAVQREQKRKVPKYEYPFEVCTAAMVNKYSKHGIEFAVRRDDCLFIRSLDSQRAAKKAIYGGGLLLSEKAAAERAAAERAAAERWQLSDREREIVSAIGS